MTTDNDPLVATKAELLKLERELAQRLEEMDRSESRPKMDGAVGRLTFMDEYQQHQMAEHGRRNVESQLGRVHAAMALRQAARKPSGAWQQRTNTVTLARPGSTDPVWRAGSSGVVTAALHGPQSSA